MAEELARDSQKLQLTEKEEEVLEFGDDQVENVDPQVALSQANNKKYMAAGTGYVLGDKLGRFLEVDQTDLFIPSKFMRVRADFDLPKPLQRVVTIKLSGNPTWIKIKYVKLPDFGYACGILGHACRRCSSFDPSVPDADLQYGRRIRASELRKRKKRQARKL
ncbi:hypothetical protein Cgig2_009503 [Carnegiea gigantea]|uniref:Zinc knuckle CX2CX4HX4C domain-containing protein n=1 Tax=Carnegiea gigantea TaxID=171969 RepID=A0A9Q1Q846_9CARY|nr:hypothetical protein Cgig2_009503 [Carnegiea gigantea]